MIDNETNIWAALDRIKDFSVKKQAEIVQKQFEQKRHQGKLEKLDDTQKGADADKNDDVGKEQEVPPVQSLQRTTSRVDQYDYFLTLQNKHEIKEEELTSKIEQPKLVSKRSNSAKQF